MQILGTDLEAMEEAHMRLDRYRHGDDIQHLRI